MKKLIETIASNVMSAMNKTGYGMNEPGSGIITRQDRSASGGNDCNKRRGRGGGKGQCGSKGGGK